MAREIGRACALLLLVLAQVGCAGRAMPAALAPPPATATPATPHGSWAQALVLSGDVEGTMDHVVEGSDAARSECSGRNSRPAGAWASALFGLVGQDVYEVMATVRPYRGPGVYRVPDVTVQVARQDGAEVWQTSAGDPATFTVGAGEESGSVDATLTNLSTEVAKLRLTGRWACQT
jgi:hypothetical protein